MGGLGEELIGPWISPTNVSIAIFRLSMFLYSAKDTRCAEQTMFFIIKTSMKRPKVYGFFGIPLNSELFCVRRLWEKSFKAGQLRAG